MSPSPPRPPLSTGVLLGYRIHIYERTYCWLVKGKRAILDRERDELGIGDGTAYDLSRSWRNLWESTEAAVGS